MSMPGLIYLDIMHEDQVAKAFSRIRVFQVAKHYFDTRSLSAWTTGHLSKGNFDELPKEA